ncbi:transposable element [Pseudoloma neurophilia]|uniref:Transposable element n=1 Tax=Pseudoloma neurophilia TaxID=146866 RepID=A0A0R0M2X3_9MICR|nr:transposable element [Pseudoloma neurophilia]
MSGVSPGRRKPKCYSCGELGHISRFFNSKEVKGKFEYSGNSSFEKRWKRQHLEIRNDLSDLDDFIEYFPNVFLNLDRSVEFCPIEKCSINTEEGKIVVKKGATVQQVEEKQAEEYLLSLIKKKEIQLKENPKCIKDLRSFLSSVGWFRTFMENFATKTENLTEGFKKKEN